MQVLDFGQIIRVVCFLPNLLHNLELRLGIAGVWLVVQLRFECIVPRFKFNKLSSDFWILDRIWVRQFLLYWLRRSCNHKHLSMSLDFPEHLLVSHILVVSRQLQSIRINDLVIHLIDLDLLYFFIDINA